MVEVEEPDNRQRVLLHEAIAKIKRDTESDDTRKHIDWFDTAILPLLKDFAEQTGSSLEIQRDEIGIITTCMRNPNGLDITESCHGMYLALLLALRARVENDKSLKAVNTRLIEIALQGAGCLYEKQKDLRGQN